MARARAGRDGGGGICDVGEYELGAALAVEVRMAGGVLRVTVNGKQVTYRPPVNPADRYYFKAGDYSQCHPCVHTGQYAEVHLSGIHATHSNISLDCLRGATRLCADAKKASAGNCYVCTGQHQAVLHAAGCSDRDVHNFCTQQ